MLRNNLKILIADDHPLLVKGMENVVGKIKGVGDVFTAGNGREALEIIENENPHIAILDIEMPGMTGIELARIINKKQYPVRIIFLTLHKERSIFEEARKIGIKGYVLKEFSIDEIEKCLIRVSRGETFISPKLEEILRGTAAGDLSMLNKTEKNILKLIARNKTTKEIADMLFLSPKTIENNRYNICKKLDLPAEKNSLIKWTLNNKALIDNI